MLTVCFLWTQCFLGIQNWTTSLLTHFSWQTLSLKVYLSAIRREGQGHKNSSRSPNNCLANVNALSIGVSWPDASKSFDRFKHHRCFLWTPALSFLSQTFFQLLPTQTSFSCISFTYPQNQLSSPLIPVFQSHVNFRLNIQTHRAVRYTDRRLTHYTSEPKP